MTHKMMSSILMATAIAALSCATEEKQSLPVTTKSPSGVSTAPPSQAAETRNRALVRFIHAVPEVATADVFADDMLVFTNVAYQGVTAYREVPDNRLTFRVRPAGQYMAEPIADEAESLSAGKHYTVIVMRAKQAKADISVLEDDLVPPAPGKAKVRWVNATADLGEVDVFAPGSEKPLFGGVNNNSATKYAEVSPLSGSLEVHREGEKTNAFTIPNVDFQSGKIYTVVITGHGTGGDNVPLKAIIVEDRFG